MAQKTSISFNKEQLEILKDALELLPLVQSVDILTIIEENLEHLNECEEYNRNQDNYDKPCINEKDY